MATVAELIDKECREIASLLCSKNVAYGNSALEPLRVFSRSEAEEGIRVRIDDKLSRIAQGTCDNEDTEQDLIGYLILLRVSRAMKDPGAR